MLRSVDVDAIRVRTDQPYTRELMRFFRARRRGRGPLRLAVALSLTLVSGGVVAAEAPVTVTTRVEPDTVRIGTPFRYYVRVETSGEAEVVMPLLVDRIGDFLIRDYGAGAAHGGAVSERWYELVGYTPGIQLVDGGSIAYRVPGGGLEEVEVPDAAVTIESMLDGMGEGELATADLRDIRGPVGVPEPARPWWLLALALVTLAAAGFAVARWWRRKEIAAAAPSRPPHEIALEALGALHRARLLDEGRSEEFYVRLSAIVRDYVEGASICARRR
jgi:hypothetical protein